MKLMDSVNAYLAAEEMSRQTWPYDLALAVAKIKRATKEDFDFFVQKEQELVKKYAALDEHGDVRLTPQRTFVFKDPDQRSEYERARKELGDTSLGDRPLHFRVKAPAEIKPAYIEALENFLEFTAEGART